MNFPEEDDRVPEMDKLWLLEKEEQMFVEWQQWESEHNEHQLPAIVTIEMPKFELDEVQSDSLPF
jgi:hypothetical protein